MRNGSDIELANQMVADGPKPAARQHGELAFASGVAL